MSMKTAEYTYNEDNFVEENESLRELTVTITLGEYRNLIVDQISNEKKIESLHNERVDLNEQISTLYDNLRERERELECLKEEYNALLNHISVKAIERL